MRYVVFVSLLLLAAFGSTGCSKEDRAQRYLERGTELFEQGDLTKARLEIRNVLQIDARQPQAWFVLAQIEEGEKNWRPAFQAYSRAVELDPQNHAARIKLGTILLAGGKSEEALSEAEAILTADPDNAGALVLRGAVRATSGDLAGGARDSEAALAIDANHPEALALLADIRKQQARPEDAKALLERAVAANPEKIGLRQALARAHEALGETEAVVAVLKDIAAQQPEAFAPQLMLARYLAAQEQLDAAEATLRAAVAAAPDDRERKMMLVQFVAETEGEEAAIKELETWIAQSPDDEELRFLLAERHGASGRVDAMVDTYETIIDVFADEPAATRARGKLATLALARGDNDRALALAEEALATDEASADALLVRAAIHLRGDETEQAIADLRSLLRNDPQSVQALRLLAKAHVQRDEIALAQDALQIAIEAAPTTAPAHLELAELRLRSGDPAGAAQILEGFLARVPDSGEAQTALARLQLSQQDTEALASTAERVLTTRPEHPLGYYLKGLVFQGNGDHDAAIAEFETALEKEPAAAEPLIAIARSYLALDQPQQAEQRVEQLLAEDPDNLVAMNLLGDIYLANGRSADARAQFATIMRRMPQSPRAYERLSRLQLRDGDLDGALETIQIGVDATGRNLVLVQTLGLVQQEAGDTDAAMAAYEEVLKRAPGATVSANNLAMLIANRQWDDPARLAYARELTESFEESDQPVLLDTAGWVLYRSGNFGRSIELLEQAAEQGLDSAEHHYHLGMAYLKVDRIEEGQALLRQALDSGEAFPGIDEARSRLKDDAA